MEEEARKLEAETIAKVVRLWKWISQRLCVGECDERRMT